jgi:hypothetical protein
LLRSLSPRSSGERATASGAVSAGSNPAGGTGYRHKFEHPNNLDASQPRVCDLRLRNGAVMFAPVRSPNRRRFCFGAGHGTPSPTQREHNGLASTADMRQIANSLRLITGAGSRLDARRKLFGAAGSASCSFSICMQRRVRVLPCCGPTILCGRHGSPVNRQAQVVGRVVLGSAGHHDARFGLSPITGGKTNVAPNIATTCRASGQPSAATIAARPGGPPRPGGRVRPA